MRAATPKADPSLRPPASTPDPGRRAAGRALPADPLAGGAERFRTPPGATWPGPAANDDLPPPRRRLPQGLLATLVLLLDLLAILGAGLVADALNGATGAQHAPATLLIAGLAALSGAANGAYRHAALFSLGTQFRRVGAALALALCATLAAALAFDAWARLDGQWLAAAAPLGGLALLAGRAAVTGLVRHEGGARTARRAVVVGGGVQAARLLAALRDRRAGIEVTGLVEDGGARAPAALGGVPVLGGMTTLSAMIRRGEVEMVLIALPWSDEGRIVALLDRLSAYPVEVRLAPDLAAAVLADPRPARPVLVRARPISGAAGAAKALFDYLLAAVVLTVAAVPMLMIAIAVKLDSPGPVLFRQRRTGFNDRPFDVFKFRTMYQADTDHEAKVQVLHGDPRVTRVGAVLRRTSLDELPQVFNVLRGEMSFVGPRPHAPGTRAGKRRFDEVVANYAARHRVKPGLTGLAQVRGWRGPTTTEDQILKRVESDLEYIDGWTPWLDVLILLRTLLVVVRMRNAL